MTPLQEAAWKALEGSSILKPITSDQIAVKVWGRATVALPQQNVQSLIAGLRRKGFKIGARRGITGGYWRIEG